MASNDAPEEKAPEPVSFELEQNDLYGKYTLTTPLDILFVLRSLIKRGSMATVYFNHGKSFFLTWVLGLTPDERSIILDVGSDPAVNREALKADRLIVTANLDNVKIQFAVNGVGEISHDDRPAFAAPIPQRLLRLQRREYFRLNIPLSSPVRCQVPAEREGAPAQLQEYTLQDISGGGLSLMVPTKESDAFAVGAIFADCRLRIPEESVILVTLCVRNAFRVTTRSGQEYLRIGCEFVSLPGARLNLIQRYITRVERERKAREVGLD